MKRIETQEKSRRRRFSRYVPLIVWVGVILLLGSGPGSMAQTSRFIRPLIEFFVPSAHPDTVSLIHAVIRKSAHFVEYAILAFFAFNVFSASFGEVFRKYWFAWTLLVVVAVAVTDEIKQSFSLLRTGTPYDVLLDIAGGTFVILLILGLRRMRRQNQNQKRAP